jgi:hypothetical protein
VQYLSHLVIRISHNDANNLASKCIIYDNLHTRINTYIFNNFNEHLPMYCASLYFLRASIAFKKTSPFWEDTMKLMSGWHVAPIHPSKTILTPDEGHDDLIGYRILSTSFFALSNNVVLKFFVLGGTYLIGPHSTRARHISINKEDRATLNEMKLR